MQSQFSTHLLRSKERKRQQQQRSGEEDDVATPFPQQGQAPGPVTRSGLSTVRYIVRLLAHLRHQQFSAVLELILLEHSCCLVLAEVCSPPDTKLIVT